MIDVSMDRSGGERQFTIDWAVVSACLIDLANVSVIFRGIRKNLKKWQMHGFPINSYFAEIQTFIVWNQWRFAISPFGR